MSNDNTDRDAEPSPASAGSHGDAVGWILFHGDRMTFDVVFETRDEAEKYSRAYERKPDIVPVYRFPALTDEEREVLLAIEADASYRAMERTGRVVRGLLERTK